MKKLLSYVGISLTVSIFTLTAYHFSGLGQQLVTVEKEVNQLPAVQTRMPVYTADDVVNMPPDFRLAASKAMPAVVHIKSIKTYRRRRSSLYEELFGWGLPSSGQQNVSTGSGVIISGDGYIVTNNHVIEEADELEVTLYDGRNYAAIVIGTDPSTDLGLIKINDNDLPNIKFSNSDEANVGEWVLAVGNPFNLASTATAGIVSAIGRNLEIIKDEMAIESFIQTDAAVNPGNSGGALVNLEGNLLGINTAIASPTGAYAGYAFAVPANIVRKVVTDLREFGAVQRGFIGISRIINLNSSIARELKYDITEGVIVESLMSRSAAAEAGILEGDVIVSVDNVPTPNDTKLLEMIGRNRPGDFIDVKVYRNGAYRTFKVQLTNQDGTTTIRSIKRNPALNAIGIELEDVDPDYLRRYGVDNGVQISKLFAGKLRRDTDIKEGFIILKVNGAPVTSAEGLIRFLERTKGRIELEGFYPGGRYLYDYTFNND